jgi:hypothetical protein
MSEIRSADPQFHFVVEVKGADLFVNNVICTWFGGPNDPSDSGHTASGVSTRDHPDLLGCALPMDGFHSAKTDGSPVPKLPWNTFVRVTNRANGKSASVPVIDLGPSKFAASHAAIDLTEPAFRLLGGDPRAGVMRVDFAVPGGAKFLPSAPDSDIEASAQSIRSSERALIHSEVLSIADSHGPEHEISKPVIKGFIQSPNYSSRNGTRIDMVVLHCTTSSTVGGTINWFLNRQSQVSAHYIIDRNGDIYQMVPDSDCAWHAKSANRRSIGIEHVGSGADRLTQEQSAASVDLVRWLMSTYDVPVANIVGHRFAPGNEGTTSCPDHLFGEPTEQAVTEWVRRNFAIA